jgi:hypothetical protein
LLTWDNRRERDFHAPPSACRRLRRPNARVEQPFLRKQVSWVRCPAAAPSGGPCGQNERRESMAHWLRWNRDHELDIALVVIVPLGMTIPLLLGFAAGQPVKQLCRRWVGCLKTYQGWQYGMRVGLCWPVVFHSSLDVSCGRGRRLQRKAAPASLVPENRSADHELGI